MRLATYRHPGHGEAEVGVIQGDRVVRAAALLPPNAGAASASSLTMASLLEQGPAALAALAAAAERFAADYADAVIAPVEIAVPLWESTLLAPLPRPASIRDFYGFEGHVARAYARRNRPIPPVWREMPVFYFGCAATVVGPYETVVKPAETNELDFELEVAAIIGQRGQDISAADAWTYVAGLTILNDWSARDIQRREMSVGLGPAKGKDFATSLGPWIVTLDELADRRRGDHLDLAMIARVNDEEVSRGNLKDLFWPLPAMIAAASRNVKLEPGDIIATGTVETGCLLDQLTAEGGGVEWLQPGDEVELEVERLGRLRNVIAG
jgi:2-keto-4-pentenoate hydratase/2-oxohepta-3-ene-1,7-dioic acid hydratase in catechol pathway